MTSLAASLRQEFRAAFTDQHWMTATAPAEGINDRTRLAWWNHDCALFRRNADVTMVASVLFCKYAQHLPLVGGHIQSFLQAAGARVPAFIADHAQLLALPISGGAVVLKLGTDAVANAARSVTQIQWSLLRSEGVKALARNAAPQIGYAAVMLALGYIAIKTFHRVHNVLPSLLQSAVERLPRVGTRPAAYVPVDPAVAQRDAARLELGIANQQVVDITQARDAALRAAEELRAEIARVNAQLDARNATIGTNEAALAALRAQLEHLQANPVVDPASAETISALQINIEAIGNQLVASQEESAALQQRIGELEPELNNLRPQAEELQRRLDSAEAELRGARDAFAELKESNVGLQAANNTLERELSEIRSSTADLDGIKRAALPTDEELFGTPPRTSSSNDAHFSLFSQPLMGSPSQSSSSSSVQPLVVPEPDKHLSELVNSLMTANAKLAKENRELRFRVKELKTAKREIHNLVQSHQTNYTQERQNSLKLKTEAVAVLEAAADDQSSSTAVTPRTPASSSTSTGTPTHSAARKAKRAAQQVALTSSTSSSPNKRNGGSGRHKPGQATLADFMVEERPRGKNKRKSSSTGSTPNK